MLAAPRLSRDIDIFHDTQEALIASWGADRKILAGNGYEIRVVREAPSFVEALVQRSRDTCSLEWARDSAFRFYPLIEDSLMGLALHPFDLATNKILAMAGRLEVRDWIDVLNCDRMLQPFGYLVWAACGKDPGYNPQSLLAAARRLHYSQPEVDTLDFEHGSPDAAALGRQWHDALDAAAIIVGVLPVERVGTCVLVKGPELCRIEPACLGVELQRGTVSYHQGRIGGSWPRIVA
jgi:hypothetical protein